MSTLFVTTSGKTIDLHAPKVEDIDFADIAEQLAKEARFNGATPGVFYPVAQHLVLGADFIQRMSKPAAAYFLCHDFHEAYLKDDTTPKKRTLDKVAQSFGTLSDAVSEAYAELTERFDKVIHEAAGLEWPMRDDMEHLVETVDRAILVTEWLQLRPDHPLPKVYQGVDPLPIEVNPWDWEYAQWVLENRMRELLPALEATRE